MPLPGPVEPPAAATTPPDALTPRPGAILRLAGGTLVPLDAAALAALLPPLDSDGFAFAAAGTLAPPTVHRVPATAALARARAVAERLALRPADRVFVDIAADDPLACIGGLLAALSAGATAILGDGAADLAVATAAAAPTVLLTTPDRLAPHAAPAAGWLGRRLRRRPAPFAAPLRLVVTTGTVPPPSLRPALAGFGLAVADLYGRADAGGPVAVDLGDGLVALPGIALAIAGPDADGLGMLHIDGVATGDLGRADPGGGIRIVGRAATRLPRPDGSAVQAEALEAAYGRHPFVGEIAVLGDPAGPFALVRPDLDAIRASATARIDDAVRVALAETAAPLPRGWHLAGHALVRQPLPRTRRGEPVRHRLADIRAAALAGNRTDTPPDPLDAALLADPAAARLWQWLRGRFAGRALSLDDNLQLDLAIDSLEWVTFALELEQAVGVPLDEEVLARAATLRDLLVEAVERQGRPVVRREEADPLELSDAQRRWITPVGPAHDLLGLFLYGLNLLLMKLFFRLRVEGAAHIPRSGAVLFAVNHLSDLDPPIVAAALGYGRLRRTYWSGEITRLFRNALARHFARAVRMFPVNERLASSSLAFATAVLRRGDGLIWFPESWRSPDGRLQRFMPGIGRLVAETGATVVPARIEGTFEAMPRGSAWPRLHPVTIRFAPPIPAAEIVRRAGPEAGHAALAAVVREAVAALPGEPAEEAATARRGTAAPAGSPLRHAIWALQAVPMWLGYAIVRQVGLDAASAFGGRLARAIGPRLRLSERARHNLRRSWPGMAPAEIERIVAGMWDNLGRIAGEIMHLDKLRTDGPEPRIELVGAEHIAAMKRDPRPAIAFTAHLANWELGARVAALHGLKVTLVYRQANNPWAERLIQHCRGDARADLVPKGPEAAQRIAEAMRTGGLIGMVVDQKTNNGVPAPFFGRTAMTTPVLATCALAYGCPLYPVQVERLGGAHFRVTVHPPLPVVPGGDAAADTLAVAAAMNATIEGWVRQRPEQWMWVHRRWPD